MSEMAYKTVLRFPLPQYHNWGVECVLKEINPIVKNLNPTPDNDYEDDIIEWYFHNGRIRLVSDIRCCTYFIDYVIAEGFETDDFFGNCVRFTSLEKSAEQLCSMFNIFRCAVNLHVYRYYTGSDEPINGGD